jgi:hypothetical protein
MTVDAVAIIALGTTVLVSVAVALYVQRLVSPLLRHQGVGADQVRFWTGCGRIFLILGPVTFQMTVPEQFVTQTGLAGVLTHVRGGMAGVLGSLLMVMGAVGLSALNRTMPVWVPAEQVDDLNRLMSRVRELRAREIISQVDATEPEA